VKADEAKRAADLVHQVRKLDPVLKKIEAAAAAGEYRLMLPKSAIPSSGELFALGQLGYAVAADDGEDEFGRWREGTSYVIRWDGKK